MDMKFCIWGCGVRGKNVLRFMDKADIRAFIDSDPALQGRSCEGLPVISYEQYLERFRDCAVIVTPHYEHYELLDRLKRDGVKALSVLLLPPEVFEMPVPGLFDVIDEKTGADKTLFLYGLNLYTLLLLKRYFHRRAVKAVPEKGVEEWLLQYVGRTFPGCLGTLDEVGRDTLYLTSNEYERCDIPAENKSELYDFLPLIKEYYNPELEQFRRIHAGKRCFIVATGPSLRTEDLDRLKESGDVCIGVNGIFKAYPSTEWRPQYYILADRDLFGEWKDILLNSRAAEHMLVADACLRGRRYDGLIRFHLSHLQVQPHCPPAFSRDFASGAYESGTVTYDCLQFAVFLGCSEIYLYGVDHSYGGRSKHFVEDYSAFDKKLKKSAFQDEQLRATLGYESARQATEELGIKIYNASRRTALDVFERVDFDVVVGRKKKLEKQLR